MKNSRKNNSRDHGKSAQAQAPVATRAKSHENRQRAAAERRRDADGRFTKGSDCGC